MKKIIPFLFAFTLFADVYEVTQANYSSVVEHSTQPVIVDIYAPWCPACRQMEPVLDDASNRYPNILFVKINSDQESGLVQQLQVSRLPTLLFFLPGKSQPTLRSTGALTMSDLDEKIRLLQKKPSNNQ